MTDRIAPYPYGVFNFEVVFQQANLAGGGSGNVPLASGGFAEVDGLEANMEPKVIKEGGLNFGAHQRVGAVTFATVVLKRGVTRGAHLWKWFDLVAQGASTYRLNVTITLKDPANEAIHSWTLLHALPVKFKAASLNARGTEVGIEELHLAHEGLSLEIEAATQK